MRLSDFAIFACCRQRLYSFLFLIFFLLPFCSSSPSKAALWSPETKSGDFGFNFCQEQLDENITDQAKGLREQRYFAAYFFGSTNTYDFIDILGEVGISGDQKVSHFSTSGIETETDISADSLTVLTDVSTNGKISSAAVSILGSIGIDSTTEAWSFTKSDGMYHTGDNCGDAASSSSDENGRVLKGQNISESSVACGTSVRVICISTQ